MTRDQIEHRTANLHRYIRMGCGSVESTDITTVVTIASIHDGDDGQWIIGGPGQDKTLVAKRLRRCADLLEREAPL